MKTIKHIIFIISLFVFYLLLTGIYNSYNNFSQGLFLGYPVFYYEFYIGHAEKQWGTNPLNLIVNLIIVIIIYAFIRKIRHNKTKV
jgi:Na+/melibiose symporter-like transporter